MSSAEKVRIRWEDNKTKEERNLDKSDTKKNHQGFVKLVCGCRINNYRPAELKDFIMKIKQIRM